ncbi:MAG: hypothetical protein PHU03_07290 [Syntrophales bacterium]|nr:hypothetical protein [Syntrophales bacterium]
MTYKQSEVLNPEAVLRSYMNGSYEDKLELRGMMKLRAAMLMVMELANLQRVTAEADTKRFAPVLEMLKESRVELDGAAARARDSSTEIAHAAALETAEGMKGAFSAEMRELKSNLVGAQTPEMNPMAKTLLTTMQPYLAKTMGQLFSSLFKPGQQPGAAPQNMPQAVATPDNQPDPYPASDVPPPGLKEGESYSELMDDMMTLKQVDERNKGGDE